MRGRTLVGQRIIEQRAARRQALAAQTDAAGLEGEIACGLAGASRKGLQDALNSADMVQHFASTFAAQMKAVAPLDAVVVMAREIARRETEVQEHMLSHPSHALVPQAWAVAMKQAASALHGSFASPQVAPT